MYLQNMTTAEQATLILRCKDDSELLGKVVSQNSNLIWHTVHKYLCPGLSGNVTALALKYNVDPDDIYQLGCLGFIKAVRAFDPYRGVKFSTFACPTIYREIKDYFRDKGSLIRPTRTASELLHRVSKELRTSHDESLTYEELADRVGATVAEVTKILGVTGSHSDIDEMALPVEDAVLAEIDTEVLVTELAARLCPEEREVLRFLLKGYEPGEIATHAEMEQRDVEEAIFTIQLLMKKRLPPESIEKRYAHLIEQAQEILSTKPNIPIKQLKNRLGVSEALTIYIMKIAKATV